jgi:hypothetical protein
MNLRLIKEDKSIFIGLTPGVNPKKNFPRKNIFFQLFAIMFGRFILKALFSYVTNTQA